MRNEQSGFDGFAQPDFISNQGIAGELGCHAPQDFPLMGPGIHWDGLQAVIQATRMLVGEGVEGLAGQALRGRDPALAALQMS